jgi:hypothetical protein
VPLVEGVPAVFGHQADDARSRAAVLGRESPDELECPPPTTGTCCRGGILCLAAEAAGRWEFFSRWISRDLLITLRPNALFVAYLGTMMIPFVVTMIPTFVIVARLGWQDTYQGLVVRILAQGVFGTFLFRQFFMGIPEELGDAATVDGANPFDIYWRIYLPLSGPALTAYGVITALWAWNMYIWAADCRPIAVAATANARDRPVLGRDELRAAHSDGLRHAEPDADLSSARGWPALLRRGRCDDRREGVAWDKGRIQRLGHARFPQSAPRGSASALARMSLVVHRSRLGMSVTAYKPSALLHLRLGAPRECLGRVGARPVR